MAPKVGGSNPPVCTTSQKLLFLRPRRVFRGKPLHFACVDTGRLSVRAEHRLEGKGRGRGAVVAEVFQAADGFAPIRPMVAGHPPRHIVRPAVRLDVPVPSAFQRLSVKAVIAGGQGGLDALPERQRGGRKTVAVVLPVFGKHLCAPHGDVWLVLVAGPAEKPGCVFDYCEHMRFRFPETFYLFAFVRGHELAEGVKRKPGLRHDA